ncbi:MAG: GNAT family N-acetyltransferase [Myxococcota bacterium]
MSAGYQHPDYVASLSEFGEPLLLPGSGGALLVRPIPGSDARDAMGAYPLLSCSDWSGLPDDLETRTEGLVSVVAVTDPFGNYDEALLERCFDFVRPWKHHFVADSELPVEKIASKNHRKMSRRAQRLVEVETCADPSAHADEVHALYGVLIERHGLRGIHAFSKQSLARQLEVPGMVMFRATHEGEVVGLDLWYVQDDVAQGHLAMFSEKGYEVRASFATKWHLIEHFRGRARWINFGGAAGTDPDADDGLTRFKRGWSSETRPSYLCGKILDPKAYDALVAEAGAEGAYFPLYRAGEFA